MNESCKYCDKELNGRKGKMFCNHYCKSTFHNEKDKNKPPTIFQLIDKQLKLNRRLLVKYNQAGKATVRKSVLLQAGFNPKYFTNYWKNKKGDVYLFCYEFGFLEIPENGKAKYVLVKWQDYMNS